MFQRTGIAGALCPDIVLRKSLGYFRFGQHPIHEPPPHRIPPIRLTLFVYLSLTDIGGELLLVPQFTLAADTRKGTRPSFSSAAAPELGKTLFEFFVAAARERHPKVATGVFGADMKVSLVNDGPVTFWLQAGAS